LTQEGYEKAGEAFRAALKLEPGYAPAWVALAWAYAEPAGVYRDVHEGTALGRAAVERVLELDDSLAEAHATMGWIRLYYDWDWQGSDAAIQRALALEPGNAEALAGAGLLAAVLGRHGVRHRAPTPGAATRNQAFLWLDTAYEQHDLALASVLSFPELASLKSDPRWPAFLDKMGLPH
jgi:tetratricopeptide (TPR) repeat protein